MPYETQKQKWISMSIPLKNDVAKWKFLNSVKGERYKNNTNKFELIHKQKLSQKKKRHIKLVEGQKGLSSKSNSLSKITEEDISYKLSEMNYAQFYRSPIKKNQKKDDKKSISPPTVKLIKKEKKEKIIINIVQKFFLLIVIQEFLIIKILKKCLNNLKLRIKFFNFLI